MQKIATLAAGILITWCARIAVAGPHDFAGSFSGEEQLVISKCIDKIVTSPWKAKFLVDGDSYSGEGTSPGGGNFQFKGKIVDNFGEGTVEGRVQEGKFWEGKTRSAVSAQGALSMQITGKVPTAGCDINVKIKATKEGL